MAATVTARPRSCELSASDGFGLLTTQPPQPRRPEARCFCLDAMTYWRSTTPSVIEDFYFYALPREADRTPVPLASGFGNWTLRANYTEEVAQVRDRCGIEGNRAPSDGSIDGLLDFPPVYGIHE